MLQPHAINLLKRLGERVVQNHQEYDQSNWGKGDHACHTACCFAGHICLMVDGVIPESVIPYFDPSKAPTFQRAQEVLGLTEKQAVELFSEFDPSGSWFAGDVGYKTYGSLEYAQRAQKFLNEWIEKETRA